MIGDSAAPDTPVQKRLRVANVTIDGSDDYGVSLVSFEAFTDDSTQLTVRNATLGAIDAGLRVAGSIPDGTYTGNTVDEIVLERDLDELTSDVTLHARGVPYRLGQPDSGDGFVIGSATAAMPKATLTVEPGVTVEVSPIGGLYVNAGSALVAKGSAALPIVFTSGNTPPAPGDWVASSSTAYRMRRARSISPRCRSPVATGFSAPASIASTAARQAMTNTPRFG